VIADDEKTVADRGEREDLMEGQDLAAEGDLSLNGDESTSRDQNGCELGDDNLRALRDRKQKMSPDRTDIRYVVRPDRRTLLGVFVRNCILLDGSNKENQN
jgi:hypothetical protein